MSKIAIPLFFVYAIIGIVFLRICTDRLTQVRKYTNDSYGLILALMWPAWLFAGLVYVLFSFFLNYKAPKKTKKAIDSRKVIYVYLDSAKGFSQGEVDELTKLFIEK